MLLNSRAVANEPKNLLQKQGNESFVKSVLLEKKEWLHYPSYQDRAGWDQFLGNYKTSIISAGEKALDYKWQIIPATSYLEYFRSGSRQIMETPYSQNMNAISTLFLAELAEGKGRFMDQLINGVFAACEMTTWSLSAHLNLQLNNKKFPDHNQQIIDLVAADVGSMFSWIYHFFHLEFDKTNKLIAERLKFEITRRILEPYMNVDHFWWMGQKNPDRVVNNWNVWCNSNVLQAFVLMEEDKGKLAKAIYKTMCSVDNFINYNKEDGACEEGPSYWTLAAGKLYDYLQVLSDVTGGKISLFSEPVIKNMGEYISRSYVGNRWVVNFADASARGGTGDAPLIFRYGKAVNSNEMMSFAAYLLQEGAKELRIGGRDMFRTLQSITYNKEMAGVTPALPPANETWYSQTEFLYMKNQHYFFAAKGGHNNESHNHNDIGSFMLYIDTLPFFVDAGVGTYTRQTFGSERYSIWTMQSNYHNLPLINGEAQQPGRQFKSRNVSFDPRRKKFSLDISGAYSQDAAVKSWQRSYTLSSESLKIEDAFVLSEIKESTQINFLLAVKPEMRGNGIILLQKEGRSVRFIYPSKSFKAEVDTLLLEDKKLSNVWGPQLYRLRLTVQKPVLKGTYSFLITH